MSIFFFLCYSGATQKHSRMNRVAGGKQYFGAAQKHTRNNRGGKQDLEQL